MSKKIWIGVVIYVLGFFAIATFNNWYLLWNHPLSYYYTVEGMLRSLKFASIEFVIVGPLAFIGTKIFFKEEKTDEVTVEKEES